MPKCSAVTSQRQHLIIDADDTLWDDAAYFEQAIEDFISLLNHRTLSRTQVRSILDEIELANTGLHIFGSRAFGRNLGECFSRLADCPHDPEILTQTRELGCRLLHQPRKVLEGIPETLHYLAPRHDLTLFTKGHPVEQSLKIKNSGLAIFFRHIEITRMKNSLAYSTLADRLGLDRARTWMIGNAPRSDINPALAAGLNAVYIPHAQTWHLENEELSPGPGHLIVLKKFAELQKHF
jgi:putative hydrolase of the HAD superfamily